MIKKTRSPNSHSGFVPENTAGEWLLVSTGYTVIDASPAFCKLISRTSSELGDAANLLI